MTTIRSLAAEAERLVPVDARVFDRSFTALVCGLAVLTPVALLSGWEKTALGLGICLLLSGPLVVLARRGRRRLAGLLALLMLLAFLDYEMWRSHGIRNIALVGYPGLLALGSLFLSRFWLAVLATVSIGSLAFLTHAELAGSIVTRSVSEPSWGDFLTLSFILIAFTVVLDAIVGGLRRSLLEARRDRDALERGEKRFRALIENISEVIVTLDGEGGVGYVSPAVEAVLGYGPTERLGENAFDLVHPDDAPAAREKLQHLLARTGSRDELKLRMQHKSGEWRSIELSATNLMDDPSVQGVVLSYRDTTERDRAIEAVDASEAKFASAFHANPHPMSVSRLTDARILDINTSFLETFGYQRDEVIGRTAREIGTWADPEDRDRMLEILRREGSVRDLEFHFRIHDGSLRTFLLSAEPVDVSGDACLLIASTDITDRKRAEEVLRESERKFFQMFQANPSCMAISSLETGKVLDVNQSLTTVSGWSREELIEKSAAELGFWVDGEERNELFEELISTGAVRAKPIKVRRKDGVVLNWLLSVEAIDVDDESCALFAALDVTESQQLSDELQRARRLEAMGRLAGGVAHDFSNWLTPIIGYSDLLSRTMPENEEHRQMLAQISNAGRRAAELASQLLRFSRGEMIQRRVLDLNQVVGNTERLLRRIIGEDVELATFLIDGVVKVRADRTQLEQVLLNLAVNARDAMPGGGRLVIETGVLEMSRDHDRAGLDLKPGSYAVLAVSDTGCGMDEETVSRLFEPFFTTKEVGRGTGLGLATVYGIIKQSEGEVTVFSEVGFGTTFKAYLPVVDASSDEEMPEPAGVGLGLDGDETVLLVEDQAAVREFAEAGLRSYGYDVLTASAGDRALDMLVDEGPEIDVLVTDLVMPRMGGLELAQRVRRRRPDCRVVYVSGYSGRAVVGQEDFELNAPLLHKPFSALELVRAVREALETDPA